MRRRYTKELMTEKEEQKIELDLIGSICNTCGFYHSDCQCDEYSSTEERMYNE